jgi:hypothetical protein
LTSNTIAIPNEETPETYDLVVASNSSAVADSSAVLNHPNKSWPPISKRIVTIGEAKSSQSPQEKENPEYNDNIKVYGGLEKGVGNSGKDPTVASPVAKRLKISEASPTSALSKHHKNSWENAGSTSVHGGCLMQQQSHCPPVLQADGFTATLKSMQASSVEVCISQFGWFCGICSHRWPLLN